MYILDNMTIAIYLKYEILKLNIFNIIIFNEILMEQQIMEFFTMVGEF